MSKVPSARPVSPWAFVLSLALVITFPHAVSQTAIVLFYKSHGFSNAFIGYTGLLLIPYATAFLWAPWIDRVGTKRRWLLSFHFLLALGFGALALAVSQPQISVVLTLSLVTLLAIAGATTEASFHGYLLHAVPIQQLAVVSGFRVATVRVSQLLAAGLLVKVCMDFAARPDVAVDGWMLLFVLLGAVTLLAWFYHRTILPYPVTDHAVAQAPAEHGLYRKVLAEILRLPRVKVILAFLLLFRFGEGMVLRMVAPFLLDGGAAGGLGFSVGDVAFINGTVGVIFSIVGGIAGGWAIKQFGLRRMAFPFALVMTLPNLVFVWLAVTRPTLTWTWDLSPVLGHSGSGHALAWTFNPAVAVGLAIEQTGYGLGYSVVMMTVVLASRGPYRTSIHALLLGISSVGWVVPVFLSGLIQTLVGYPAMFALGFFTLLPGLWLVRRLPIEELETEARRDTPAPQTTP